MREPGCAHTPKPGGAARVVRARDVARALIARERLSHPRSAYRVHRVKSVRGVRFDLGDATLCIPAFAGLERIEALACAACTVGAALEQRVSALFRAREPLLAMALDDAATEVLFGLSDRLYARVRREARAHAWHAGEAQSPGDEGLSLEEQSTVLALSGIEADAVAANSRGMLRPVKSLSFVVALGPDLPVHAFLPRCLRCASREGCRVRLQ